MNVVGTRVGQFAEFMHHQLLWLLIGSYVLAALIPAPGLWLRSVNLAAVADAGLPHVSVPSVLLSFLLFNAGLGVRTNRLLQLARRPTLLAVGVLANLVLPVVFILGTATTMQLWHNPREAQEILIGLALIASMPVAGSSTAWIQNADGDLALSIGLVVFSTCLSPLTTPLALYAVGWMAEGMYATALHDLAVMLVIVAVMCVAGFAAGAVIGWSARADRPQRASLMFGLGMTNNGAGLVIAAWALAHIPAVMLPVIFYNLIQHVVAGCVDHYWLDGGDKSPPNQKLRVTGEA